MDIQTVMVGGGPMASMVVLRPRAARGEDGGAKLPIRIGSVEATAISLGVEGLPRRRPLTHDLLLSAIGALGASVSAVEICDVQGETFFAKLDLIGSDGRHLEIDARPSDAIALAVRAHIPIFADEKVLGAATLPDFDSVEREEEAMKLDEFHEFVEGLSPEDFA